MKKTGKIKGIVTTEFAKPILDCSVTIVEGPTHNDISPLTDAEGEFSLDNLIPGIYIIKVNSVYGSTDNIKAIVKAKETTLVEVWFKTSQKNGTNNDFDQIVDEE